MKSLKSETVLRYSPIRQSRSTVARHYQRWRASQGIPVRCDVPECVFHTAQLEWLGSKLPMVLDHISGNSRDNRQQNLRYLCPNCDSQLSTRGGANRGRVQEAIEGRFVLMQRDGKLHTHVLLETITVQIKAYPPKVITSKRKEKRSFSEE